jgi:glycosyltransferase involved in cell wall biosynthesis
LVSIVVLAYQHVSFIRQCLDGILSQQTKFPFEIILGEDESRDGTRDICIEYARAYPQQIRLFLRKRTESQYACESKPVRFNWAWCMRAAQGKYIAVCEGDDYWTDEHKLQRQVDYLEQHPDCALCVTNARRLIAARNELTPPLFQHLEIPVICRLPEILSRNFVITCTTVFRRSVGTPPVEALLLAQSDWTTWVLCATKGYIGYLPDCTAVYRVHAGGLWSGATPAMMYQSAIESYAVFREMVGAEQHALIDRKRTEMEFRLAHAWARTGEQRRKAWGLAIRAGSAVWQARAVPRRLFFATWLWLCMPVRFLRVLRGARAP